VAPHPILILRNTVRTYAWGSRTAIADLLGAPFPTAEPQAELWMGAHPGAPSRVVTDEGEIPLDAWIARDPEAILGPSVAARFGAKLPFLFKMLAVERPLSIQAHPSLEQARAGFARENAAGIPLGDPKRSYKDDNHKPELICALTPFQALSRFREVGDIAATFEALAVPEFAEIVAALRADPRRDNLARFFRASMTGGSQIQTSALTRARAIASDCGGEDTSWSWVCRLSELYPDDMGALAPLFLNLVTLEPGEAMFLGPGEPHCYLGGTALEIMGNSDNVLRGGLTAKHIDVEELLATLTFAAGPIERISPVRIDAGEERYPAAAEEFAFSILRVAEGTKYNIHCDRGAEIVLCSEGAVRLRSDGDGSQLDLERGESVFVPADAEGYSITGQGTLYRATAGIGGSCQ
jgi:mannose-6-phosphate isomerase